MEHQKIDLRKVLYLISAFILLAGLTIAFLIYRAALADSTEDSGYQIIGGFIYPAEGLNSKKYMHDLQLYGGNAAVLSDEFMRWFLGLWHGRSLAYTVACIAAFVSFIIFVVANNVRQPGRASDSRDGKK